MSSDREEDHRSVLATIGQLRESLELSARDEEAAQSVAAGLRDAKAANTRRVYASAWHEFNVWALANGRQSLPAEPQTVALYLGRLAADGRAMATIALARAAISHAHVAEGTAKGDNPARHPVVAEVVKGWRNQAPAPKQADTPSPPRPWHASRRPPDFPGAAAEDGWRRRLRPGPGPPLTWQSSESWRTAALGSRSTDVERRRVLARRDGPPHGPEGQESAGPGDSGAHRDHRPRPARNPVRRRGPRRTGLRPDRRDAGQPDSCRCSSCRPGRRLLRTQLPHRHGPADGGRRGADCDGPAPRALEARRHGRPVHPGRGCRGGLEVVELASVCSPALHWWCGINHCFTEGLRHGFP